MTFDSPAAIFVSSFVIGLSGALMPGPLLAVTVRGTMQEGFKAAPLLVAGHALLEAALVALLLAGLSVWLKGSVIEMIIPLSGSAVLLWMGVGMAREVRTIRFVQAEGEKTADGENILKRSRGSGRLMLDGAVVSASNPYWIVWWATIGLGYLLLSRGLGRAGLLLFFAGHILSDAAWYLFVGFAVSAGRGRLTDRHYRAVVGACAVCLFFFAAVFGYRGFLRLMASL